MLKVTLAGAGKKREIEVADVQPFAGKKKLTFKMEAKDERVKGKIDLGFYILYCDSCRLPELWIEDVGHLQFDGGKWHVSPEMANQCDSVVETKKTLAQYRAKYDKGEDIIDPKSAKEGVKKSLAIVSAEIDKMVEADKDRDKATLSVLRGMRDQLVDEAGKEWKDEEIESDND